MGGSASMSASWLAPLEPGGPSCTGYRCEIRASVSSIVRTESCFPRVSMLVTRTYGRMRREIGPGYRVGVVANLQW